MKMTMDQITAAHPDVATLESQAGRELLAAVMEQLQAVVGENTALKSAEPAPFSKLMMEALDIYETGSESVPELAMLSAYKTLRDGIKTPSTARVVAEMKAKNAHEVAAEMESKAAEYEKRAADTDSFSTDNRYRFAAAMFRGFAKQLREGSK